MFMAPAVKVRAKYGGDLADVGHDPEHLRRPHPALARIERPTRRWRFEIKNGPVQHYETVASCAAADRRGQRRLARKREQSTICRTEKRGRWITMPAIWSECESPAVILVMIVIVWALGYGLRLWWVLRFPGAFP